MNSILYPRPDALPAEVFTGRTFELAHATLMSWRQASGAFGGLHLHPCWEISTVLADRYQGTTSFTATWHLRGFMLLFDRTGDERFRGLAEDVVSHLLFLQTREGGFRHANFQMEPAYTCEESCPIHQGLPILALLDYAAWPSANPTRLGVIRRAIDTHWAWFERRWWRYGNDWNKPLPHAGFCGVTNQDLVIVAVLARYAVVYGDSTRYEKFGLPTLEVILSPIYYHEEIGVFERGDETNFTERSTYNEIIVPMLELTHASVPHRRIPGVIDNVVRQLFDALMIGDDGLLHVGWGLTLYAKNKSRIKEWVPRPHCVSIYPQLLEMFKSYLERHPKRQLQKKYDALEQTLAAYVFSDGTLPCAVGTRDPLFAVVSRAESLWYYLIRRLGSDLKAPAERDVPCVRRVCGEVTWAGDNTCWSIQRAGVRVFSGRKEGANAIAVGPNERLPGAALEALEKPSIVETVEIAASEARRN